MREVLCFFVKNGFVPCLVKGGMHMEGTTLFNFIFVWFIVVTCLVFLVLFCSAQHLVILYYWHESSIDIIPSINVKSMYMEH